MSRLPLPEEVTVADAIAFDAFTPEQKRIAVAGVALHEYVAEHILDAIEASRETVRENARAERSAEINDILHAGLDRLALLRQKFSTSDSRYTELGEIVADLTKLVTP
jgi:sulfur carrier protein ThiS